MTMTMTAPPRPPRVKRRERRERRYTQLPDPPKKMDMAQFRHLVRAHSILEERYANDPSTLVIGEVYLRRTAGVRSNFTVPDCMVAFDVDAAEIDHANGYVIDEVGKPPAVVIEVASSTTGVRDYTIKRWLYRDMGAGEYWRFDETGGQYHDEPLAGDILVGGAYRRIEIRRAPDGSLWGYSPALALHLVWDDGALRFFDPEVGDFLPDLMESKRQTAEAKRQTAEANRRAAASDRRAASERAARAISERRADRSDRRADISERRAAAERAARTESELRAAAERAARAESERRAAAERAARTESERRAAAERAARIEAEAELERLRQLLGDLE